MIIERKSPFSGLLNTMEIAVTPAQLKDWQSGTLIQHAMPHLSPDEREFLMTGILPEEWEETFRSCE